MLGSVLELDNQRGARIGRTTVWVGATGTVGAVATCFLASGFFKLNRLLLAALEHERSE